MEDLIASEKSLGWDLLPDENRIYATLPRQVMLAPRVSIHAAAYRKNGEELAEIAKLSPFYFSHMFKRETGFAPMEYVINTRIEHAKTLLLTTNRSIADIAEEVGYVSSASLINLFVKKVGESPGKYRKSHKSLEVRV